MVGDLLCMGMALLATGELLTPIIGEGNSSDMFLSFYCFCELILADLVNLEYLIS